MSHTQQAIGAFIFLMTLGYLLIGRSKRQDPREMEDGKIRQLYPKEDSPEESITDDNYPHWKRVQNN